MFLVDHPLAVAFHGLAGFYVILKFRYFPFVVQLPFKLRCSDFHGRKEIVFGAGMEAVGPVMSKLRNTLTSIQSGEIEAPEADWICKIC